MPEAPKLEPLHPSPPGAVEPLATLSAQFATLLRTGDWATLRTRFEEVLMRIPGVRFVRLSGEPGFVAQRTPGPDRWRVRVSSASGVDAILEVLFDSAGHRKEARRMIAASVPFAALVLEIERQPTPAASAGTASKRKERRAILGSSEAMRTLRERIDKLARTDFTVLIEGESGVGKELVAREIHERSRRRRGPFVAINCAALVETLLEAELFGIEDRTATGVRGRRGKFEHADGGTLFLDEVSDLSLAAQSKLLRAIQELAVERVGGQGTQQVDTRIIVATNRSLRQLVEDGGFRMDLFYRLNCLEVRVPPLRVRPEDIVELVHALLDRYREFRDLTPTDAVMDALVSYEWPGNVRELERVIERAVTLADESVIEIDDLPTGVTRRFSETLMPSLEGNETMRAWGSRYARLILRRCNNNKRKACRRLGISYHTLQAYLRYPIRTGSETMEADEASVESGEGDRDLEEDQVFRQLSPEAEVDRESLASERLPEGRLVGSI